MRCPKCERLENVLSFKALSIVERYAKECNPIVKCPNCGWLFSPAMDESVLFEAFESLAITYGVDRDRLVQLVAKARGGAPLSLVKEGA